MSLKKEIEKHEKRWDRVLEDELLLNKPRTKPKLLAFIVLVVFILVLCFIVYMGFKTVYNEPEIVYYEVNNIKINNTTEVEQINQEVSENSIDYLNAILNKNG